MVAVAESCPSLFADAQAYVFSNKTWRESRKFSCCWIKILVRRGICGKKKKKNGACNCKCNFEVIC